MSLELLYIIGYSCGSSTHSICVSNNPCYCSIKNGCCSNITTKIYTCCNCCVNNYICSLLVSCGKGCYDGCIGNDTNILTSNTDSINRVCNCS